MKTRSMTLILLLAAFALVAALSIAAEEGEAPTAMYGPSSGAAGLKWIGGNSGSPFMNPGMDCIGCHSTGEGPRFAIAGTVYAKIDEKNLDLGVEGVTVEVTDAKGQVVKMTTNKSGNFYERRVNLAFPIKAKIIYKGKTREMYGARPTGDCAACHTQSGRNGAPGRIALP